MNKKILDLIFNDYEYEDVIEKSFYKNESFEVDEDDYEFDESDLDDFDEEIEEDNNEGLDHSSHENLVN